MSTTELTAEQKLRQTITGNPFSEPNFLHEGESVVRWLTGGTLPDCWATFHQEGDTIEVRCATCQNILGYLPADYNPDTTVEEVSRIRLSGHEAHKPDGWPGMNIS
jgi:hypothetical protein